MRNRLDRVKEMKKAMRRKREEDGVVEDMEPTQEEAEKEEQDEIEVERVGEDDDDAQEFEDEYEDEYEDEEEGEAGEVEKENPDGDWVDDEDADQDNTEVSNQRIIEEKKKHEAYLGNDKKLTKGEYLQFDNRAYDMLHRMTTEWPCLSIDFIVGENPFDNRSLKFQEMNKYPYEIYTVQGTQAEQHNQLYIARWSKLHKTKYDDDSEDFQDEEDEDIMNDEEPEVNIAFIDTKYPINRLRTLNSSPIVAFWNENAEVTIMDLSKKYKALQQNIKTNPKQKVDKKVYQSSAEGFAINWNPHKIGQLATGNMNCEVALYNPNENFSDWTIGGKYHYHRGSVEDIMFSPNEDYAFASCSSDGTVQIVDIRVGDYKKSQLLIKAHKKDVNVLDWNSKAMHLLATGSDDCTVKLWDLRMLKEFQKGNFEELLCFSWHEEPITSIAFQPNEESVLGVASEDNRVSVWDLAVENEKEDKDVPNELMFVHQGQEEIKELRFHPIYYEMIVSTAANGLNAFKPSFTGPEEDEDDDEEDLKKPPIREEELEEFLGRLSLK